MASLCLSSSDDASVLEQRLTTAAALQLAVVSSTDISVGSPVKMKRQSLKAPVLPKTQHEPQKLSAAKPCAR